MSILILQQLNDTSQTFKHPPKERTFEGSGSTLIGNKASTCKRSTVTVERHVVIERTGTSQAKCCRAT